jgi:signal transduction histidine kinase
LCVPFFAGLGRRYDELVEPCTAPCESRELGVLDAGQHQALRNVGIESHWYAVWDIMREGSLLVVGLVIATVLMRQIGSGIAFAAAIALTASGGVLVPEMSAAAVRADVVPLLVAAAWIVSMAAMSAVLFLLPTGRFVPRWAWLPAAALACCGSVLAVGYADEPNAPPGLMSVWLLLTAVGVGAQVYRYRLVADDVERQQLRWCAVGLAGWLCSLMLYLTVVEGGLLDPSAGGLRYPVGYLAFGLAATLLAACLPLAWAMAILRHRLWDVDHVLSRGALAAAVMIAVATTYGIVAFGVATLAGSDDSPIGPALTVIVAGAIIVAWRPAQRLTTRLFYGSRDAPYELLTALWAEANAHRADVETLRRLTERLAASLHLSGVQVVVRGETGPLVDLSVGDGGGPSQQVALVAEGEAVGTMQVWPRSGEASLSRRDVELVENCTAPFAHLAATVRLTEELRRSRSELVRTREDERARVHRDLHDDLGPSLAGQILLLEAARDAIGSDPNKASRLVDIVRRRSDEMVGDVRRIARDLRPIVLDQLGLAAALQRIGSHEGDVELVVRVGELPPLSAAVEVAVYRVVTEAYANAVRHSEARHISIDVGVVDGVVHARIEDDGTGFDRAASFESGLGLMSMRARAEEIDGHLLITTAPDAGTVVEMAVDPWAD